LNIFLENNMIVTGSDGSRKFQLAFDIRGFEPEEVKIKTQTRALIVSAKKEQKV
jgi:HSP20 family molecular chaperone IbpA